MNINDFNLLTQEEIDSTIAEVLEEAGLTQQNHLTVERSTAMSKADADKVKAFQKRQGLKVGSAGAQTAAEEKEEEERQDAQARKDAEEEMAADHPDYDEVGNPDQTLGYNPRAGAGGGIGTDTTNDPNMGRGGNLRHQQDKGRIGGARDDGSVPKDPKVSRKDAQRFGDPASDDEAGQQGIDSATRGIGSFGQAWFQPGSSNLPGNVRSKIAKNFGTAMPPSQVLNLYLQQAYKGSDSTNLARNDEYKMTAARVDKYIKRAQQSGDPTDEMEVRRVLDSMLDLAIDLGFKKAGGGGGSDDGGGDDGGGGTDDGGGGETPPEDNKGKDIPVPVNKKLSQQQRDDAGMDRSAAGSLASQLAKLFPDVDKSIITQILKDVAGQLKASNIPVQEGRALALRLILEQQVRSMVLLERGDPDDFEQKAGQDSSKQDPDLGKLKSYLKKQKQFYNDVKLVLNASSDLDDLVSNVESELDLPLITLEESLTKNLNKLVKKWIDSGRFGQAATDLLKKLTKAKKYIAHELAKVKKYTKAGKDAGNQKEDVKTSLEAFVKLYKAALKIIKASEEKVDEKPPETKPDPVANVIGGDPVLDALKARLKELDLDTDEGMYGATEPGNEQAYLGGYMFYKAMLKLQKALKKNPNAPTKDLIRLVQKELGGNEYGSGSPYSPKRTGPVNEAVLNETIEMIFERAAVTFLVKLLEGAGALYGLLSERDNPDGEDIMRWLEDTIAKFKQYQLDDSKRAVAASKVARKAKKQGKDKDYTKLRDLEAGTEAEAEARAELERVMNDPKATKADKEKARQNMKRLQAQGTAAHGPVGGGINMKSVVGPRLKQGGIDLKSPEGKKLQKQMQKVIRRFVKKNLDRIGKGDLKVIAENKELKAELISVIKEHLGQK